VILAVWGSSLPILSSGSTNGFGTVELLCRVAGNDLIDGSGVSIGADYHNDLTTTSHLPSIWRQVLYGRHHGWCRDACVERSCPLRAFCRPTMLLGLARTLTPVARDLQRVTERRKRLITGNGNTRLGFNNATAGVAVDISPALPRGIPHSKQIRFTVAMRINVLMFIRFPFRDGGNETLRDYVATTSRRSRRL